MENTSDFGERNNELEALLKNPDFIDFISYKEDKWLQNSSLDTKLNAIFGSTKKAILEFKKDEIFNSENF